MQECIFCKIIKGEIPCFKVYEDDMVIAFEDINPISQGHTLILPKRHVENIWEITEDELIAIVKAAKKIANAIKDVLNPIGLALLQLNGKEVGQEIMHYHLHIIPRSQNEPELPVSKWELKPGNTTEIKKIAQKILETMK